MDIMGVGKAVMGAVDTIADKFFMDKAEKEAFKLEARKIEMTGDLTKYTEQIKAQMAIIVAEAQGSFLQKNWRPMLMCLFGIIIANNYILYPYLSLFFGKAPMMPIPPDMWSLLKIGLGGYVLGRSGEKIATVLKKP